MAASHINRIALPIVASAALLLSTNCRAGGPIGIMPVDHSPRFMLYLSHTFGASEGSGLGRSFGIRIERPPSTTAQTQFGAPINPEQRHELADLQFHSLTNMHLEFDRRVTWDFSRRQFNIRGAQSTMALHLPPHLSGGEVEHPFNGEKIAAR